MPKPYHTIPEALAQIAARNPSSILLHTARCTSDDRHSYLFTEPAAILTAHNTDELPALFAAVQDALRQGNYAAGFVGYDCAADSALPLAWFGIYSKPCVFDHDTGDLQNFPAHGTKENGEAGYKLDNLQFDASEEEYAQKIAAIHEWIRSGDTYQVNFTGKLHFDFSGPALALYNSLIAQQPVSYAAMINLGAQQILSCSPELFFRTQAGNILTRPMKGTCARGRTNLEDKNAAAWLNQDVKNRSENVMIVDLLRNDIGRICEFGSVAVHDLFAIEKYERLFQMVSTVTGKLRSDVTPAKIFAALFPSGSITGAPKLRTMQIIRDLEQQKRGIYTGAIGYFAPDGMSVFNVAIRTIVIEEERGTMGVGSGITIDSDARDEYRECMLKADFLTSRKSACLLIESLLWDGEKYPLLELHLDRLMDSAAYFDYACERDEARSMLLDYAASFEGPHKLRLTLARDGSMQFSATAIGNAKPYGCIAIADEHTDSSDRFLFHKTTRRATYDTWFSKLHTRQLDDVIFTNERGEITEGCISNLFIERGAELLTPPVACGLLNGVFRRKVLAEMSHAREAVLTVSDLEKADAIYICNAVRGMRKVALDQARL